MPLRDTAEKGTALPVAGELHLARELRREPARGSVGWYESKHGAIANCRCM